MTRTIIAFLLGLAGWIAAGCASHAPQSPEDIRHQLARQYGLEAFERVEALRFTFNARVGDKQVRRTWLWNPTTGRVTFRADSQAAGRTFTHPLPTDTADPALRALDAKFVNDRYWLLFPLHLVWDQSAVVEDRGQAARPLGAGQARLIEVRYPPAGGYTPGDVYELFIDDNGMIAEWVYRRGGDAKPTRMTTWEDHRRLGPLMVARDHHGPEGFRVWFSDLALKRIDGETWLYPED
jgi:hypothetical protein